MGKQTLSRSLKAGLPISIGYFPAAVAFGILAKGCDVSLLECFLFSFIVFAGASQFIALNLLSTGMGPAGIILTTLLVNFRHFLMSAALSSRVSGFSRKTLVPMAFGITDEVFSVLSFTRGELSAGYVFIVELCAYTAWISGSVCGYVMGSFLPDILSKSMGVALYALLLAILIPEVKHSLKALALAISSGLFNILLIRMDFLPQGWTIIVCIVSVSLAGAFFLDMENDGEAS